MIAYVRGRVGYVDPAACAAVVETAGLGLRIFMPERDLELLPGEGMEVKVYTYLQVRDDAFVLYGFLTDADRRLFEQLLGVSGIGPKAALAILGNIDPDEFRFAVLGDDAKTIAAAPGVGIKTAKKIILELKDKMDLEEALEESLKRNDAGGGETPVRTGRGAMSEQASEAVEALTALGYSSAEALRAVKLSGSARDADAGEILKAALKHIG